MPLNKKVKRHSRQVDSGTELSVWESTARWWDTWHLEVHLYTNSFTTWERCTQLSLIQGAACRTLCWGGGSGLVFFMDYGSCSKIAPRNAQPNSYSDTEQEHNTGSLLLRDLFSGTSSQGLLHLTGSGFVCARPLRLQVIFTCGRSLNEGKKHVTRKWESGWTRDVFEITAMREFVSTLTGEDWLLNRPLWEQLTSF